MLPCLMFLASMGVDAPLGATPEIDREAEMFGGGASPLDDPADLPDSPPGDDFFGDGPGASSPAAPIADADVGERLSAEVARRNDFLAIGGFLFLRNEWNILELGRLADWPLTSPNLLNLYFDARPNERVRGYFRGRVLYNPALSSGQLNPLTLQAQQTTALLLDQFWLKFDVAQAVFVTIGRQPIRWGAGRFWNPTDFLNKQRRDPLALFDDRVGVTLIKLNLPFESLGWNLYAVADMSNVSNVEQLGGALRAEILVLQSEIALTAAKRRGGPWQLGVDASAGIGLIDFKFEGALYNGVAQQFFSGPASVSRRVLPAARLDQDSWFVQLLGGAETQLRYSDDDTIILGVEYFYNQLGYSSADYYLFAFFDYQNRGLVPPFLYLGRQYVAGYAVLLKPGNLNNTTLTASVIANLSDRSAIGRLDHQVRILTYLDLNFYGAAHFGNYGEMRLELNIPANVGAGGISQGIFRSAPRYDVGMGLRLYF